jgi:protoheme IX farnesyltransferase
MGTPWVQMLKHFETADAGMADARDHADALRRFTRAAGDYLALSKPRLLPMVLFTALPALVMASGGWPPAGVILITLLGTALAAASANTLNCYAERDRDAMMARTRHRPLPAGRIAPGSALAFGVLLAGGSAILLWYATTPLAAVVALAGILFYLFVYTVWLKPRTPLSVVVGGAAGAVAPLIADAAVDGRLGWAGALVFLIVFFWQPPHFWAIALYRKDDYARAGFPMLPLVIGDDATRRRVLGYTLVLIPVTLAPVALGFLGPLYLALALAAGAWFLHAAVRLVRRRTHAAARGMFRVSLAYLFVLLLGMIADLALYA